MEKDGGLKSDYDKLTFTEKTVILYSLLDELIKTAEDIEDVDIKTGLLNDLPLARRIVDDLLCSLLKN